MVQLHPVVSGPDTVEVMIRAELDGVHGDRSEEVKIGNSAFGFTYDQLRAWAEGRGPKLFWKS